MSLTVVSKRSGLPAPLPVSAGLFRWLRHVEAAGANLLDGESHGLRTRIRQPAALSFAPREVAAVRGCATSDNTCVELTVRHFGFFAPYGPLPIRTTESALEQQISGPGPLLEDFVNLFTTRPAIYFYRAWSQLAPVPSHERGDDRFAARLASAVGLGTMAHAVVRRARLAFGGLYVRPARSARDLAHVITATLGWTAKVTPCATGRIEMPRTSTRPRARLGSTMLGTCGFDAEHRIHIDIEIEDVATLDQWHAGSIHAGELRILVDDYLDARKVFTIDLIAPCSDAALARLGQARLGRRGWLKPQAAHLRRLLGRFGADCQEVS
jgi:type VI secretion system protein ImpH